MSKLAIHSNKVIVDDQAIDATVLVEEGIIIAIKNGLVQAEHLVDVGDSVLMAGVIDPHVHINEPGRTEWEGFDTATKAAIAGGITTLVDMPLNASPVTTTVKAFDEKIACCIDKKSEQKPIGSFVRINSKLHTNVGFWGGLVPGNENEIEPLIEKGVLGFKAFLTHSGIDEFPNVTEDDLRKAMPIIAKHGLPLLVHCELSEEVNGELSMVNTSYKDYMASRPKEWEDKAIAMMIRLCEEFNCRTHIVHLSSSNSIEQIAKTKQQGLQLTVETAQHYLYFNAEEIKDGQTQYKCAPPIREKANNDLLWQALKDGIIDFVATDHSPAPPDMKRLDDGDFMKAWGGIASIQFALPVLWTAAKKRNCSIVDMAKWLCSNPAKLIGKQSSIGQIAVGYKADLVVWNADKLFTVTEDYIHHKHNITPYKGEQLFGVVERTYLGGDEVYSHDKFIKLNKGKTLFK
jgi:allantoinase